jgi:hypothetical protein
MELIKEIVIDNPPTKYLDRKKKKIDPKTGQLKVDVHYLTANLFFAGIPFYLRSKITNEIKDYLVPHLKGLPKLQKARVYLIYYKKSDNWDLDNKGYFWLKMMLDLLKTPTPNQIQKALQKFRIIKTVECLPDDTVKYIDEIRMKYEKGPEKIVFRIFGEFPQNEKNLFD